MIAYIILVALIAVIIGMIVLHVEFRLADPDYAPGDPLPWDKLRERWSRK